MWKKEDTKSQGVADNSSAATGFSKSQSFDSSNSFSDSPRAAASIGQGIRIKGEVTGTEDLFVDGFVEGKLNLAADCSLTIGPNGNIKADLVAREIIVRGKVEGNVASPTVFADVRSDMWLAQNELFGPAVCVMPFDTPEEAIRIANETPYGLSGAIHTRNAERGAELAKEIDSGMVHVNDGTINDEPLVAFGGEKASGVGRLNGQWALEEFTTLKWVSVQHTPRHYPFEAAAKA